MENEGKTLSHSTIEYKHVTSIESKSILVLGTKTDQKQHDYLKQREHKWKIRVDKMKYVVLGFIRSNQKYLWETEVYDNYSTLCCKKYFL